MNTSKDMAQAWGIASEVELEIGKWLEKHDGKKIAVQYKKEDKLRLLRLKVWSFQQKISIAEILTMIVPVLRGQKKIWQKNVGLGISLQVLCGDTAARLLEEEVRKTYPNSENAMLWKEAEKEKQLRVEEAGELPTRKKKLPGPLAFDSPDEFIQTYLSLTSAKRAKSQAVENQSWRKHRHYRNNPWI